MQRGAAACHVRKQAPQRGFTLIELIVVLIIVGVLAAIALPRFIALGRDARLASLQAMTAALWTATHSVHTQCALTPGCDYGNYSQTLVIAGRPAGLNDGWLEAGDGLNSNQIDTWIDYSGFTASLPNSLQTKFSLVGAPDPVNCAVVYQQASGTPPVPTVTSLTSGC